MSEYVSRKYLKEKWGSAKSDMEEFLDIYNDCKPEQISKDEIERCRDNIIDKLTSIISELNKMDCSKMKNITIEFVLEFKRGRNTVDNARNAFISCLSKQFSNFQVLVENNNDKIINMVVNFDYDTHKMDLDLFMIKFMEFATDDYGKINADLIKYNDGPGWMIHQVI